MKKLLFAALLLSLTASAQTVSLRDPAGDDDGPGGYVYPTDSAFVAGSFDITGFTLTPRGGKTDVAVTVSAALSDPWMMKTGFSQQMVFVFIDTDHRAGSGHTDAPPGLNVAFAPASAWEKCIILSPQVPARVREEVAKKAAGLQADIIVPQRTKGSGHTIAASVDSADLGEGDPATWYYQVVMQSNEGFPSGGDLLTRRVNAAAGGFKFGGGTDGDCDPNVIDLLAGPAAGAEAEKEQQHAMLAYSCNADGSAKRVATITTVRGSQ